MPKVPSKTSNLAKKPLWSGPEKDGITFSLFSRFLCCPERFRLLVCEGLKPFDSFNHRIEYGSMWHTCEEAYSYSGYPQSSGAWSDALRNYALSLIKRYPNSVADIEHWYRVCKLQFEAYTKSRIGVSNSKESQKYTPILREHIFNVPYPLPSGRLPILRGKWDGLFYDTDRNLYLKEIKTKGDINTQKLVRELTFDLQTMLYLVSLKYSLLNLENYSLPSVMGGMRMGGILYSVIRRPLSGGKYSITKYKPTKSRLGGETDKDFYDRLFSIISSDPDHFFKGYTVYVSHEDIERFEKQFLIPKLEHLCDWWEFISTTSDPFSMDGYGLHYREPYGIYDPLKEGGVSNYDNLLDTGSRIGLDVTDNLFPELSNTTHVSI